MWSRIALFVSLLAGCGAPVAQVVGGGPTAPTPGTPVTSALGTELQAAGLDLHDLPSLDKLTPSQLQTVMKSFTTALGISCTGCHAQHDFAAATPQKNVARRMWTDFLGRLQFADGTPLYCDSCHQGKQTFLDRSDPTALTAWMKLAFVDPLQRKDGQPHACSTCHGDPFNPEFLSTWEKG
jgi:hypothetical protein